MVRSKSEKQLDEVKEHDLTIIPYYDQSHEDGLLDQLMKRTSEIWGGQDFVPQMLGGSQILSPDEFIQVLD